jgi:hypothetical protein
LDACRITRGGLFLDKAHTEAIQSFARAYRPLPKQKFTTVGARTDPVAVRTLIKKGRRYFYAVNRDYYPVTMELVFKTVPKGLRDLASGQNLDAPQRWSFALGPYELRSFTVDPENDLTGFTATVPPEISKALVEETERDFDAFAKVRAAGKLIPGMDEMEVRMRAALADERFAWLRRALSGYIVRECRAIADT